MFHTLAQYGVNLLFKTLQSVFSCWNQILNIALTATWKPFVILGRAENRCRWLQSESSWGWHWWGWHQPKDDKRGKLPIKKVVCWFDFIFLDFFSKWKRGSWTEIFRIWQNIEKISHHKPTNWSTGVLIWSWIYPMRIYLVKTFPQRNIYWIYLWHGAWTQRGGIRHNFTMKFTLHLRIKFRFSTQLNKQSPNKLEIYPEKILTSLLSPWTMSAETSGGRFMGGSLLGQIKNETLWKTCPTELVVIFSATRLFQTQPSQKKNLPFPFVPGYYNLAKATLRV